MSLQCPKCGTKKITRGPYHPRSFFYYYRCKKCNEIFRKFSGRELRQRIVLSPGYLFVGFFIVSLILFLALNPLCSPAP